MKSFLIGSAYERTLRVNFNLAANLTGDCGRALHDRLHERVQRCVRQNVYESIYDFWTEITGHEDEAAS